MADELHGKPSPSKSRFGIIIGLVVLAAIGVAVWYTMTAGRESTDDAQVDGHVTQIAARVGGTVTRVAATDNQAVDTGAVLVELDTRDYRVALDKAKAELADAEAAALAVTSNVPITATATTSTLATARGGLAQAESGVAAGEREVDLARARLVTAQAKTREAEANATRSARDVERFRGLLAKDEIAQQQFDAAVSVADAQKAAVDSAHSQVAEAEAGIRVAESRLMQARATEQRAKAEVAAAGTGPQQVAAMSARAAAAQAHVQQAKATLDQATLNLQYATVSAPTKGIVSRKSVEVGQIVQAGQPLMALISLDSVWITANFKETQLTDMRPGQAVVVTVDTYGGQQFKGHVDSIAAATGARFSMLPPENATGNYVKVVQRVPVKIILDGGQDPNHVLRPGMSVTPTVSVR